MFLIALVFLAFLAAPAQVVAQQPVETPDQQGATEGLLIEKLDTTIRFTAVGTSERERTLKIQIQSDAAVREVGVLNFPFSSDNERVQVDYVRVRKADGSVVDTPESNFQETPSPVTAMAPMYSDSRIKQIPVRSLAKGDVLEYRVRWIQTKPLIPNHFWYEHDFIKGSAVREETLTVSFPSNEYVKVSSPETQPQIREEEGQKIYFWKTAHLVTEKADPSGEKKPAEKPRHSVQLTTFRNWEEIGQWYRQLSADKIAVTPTIQAKATELTSGLTSRDQRQRALYDYVSTKFRYISVSFGQGRYQPHAAEEVLSNLYGDCKDKHTLLAALLKAAGIDASAALIGEDLSFDPEIPSPAQFNHVITVISNQDGSHWVDTTPEVARFGLLQKNLRNQQALVIPSTGVSRLLTTPAEPVIPTSEKVIVKAVLSSEGILTGHFDLTMQGDSELIMRAVFHHTPPTQWTELVQRMSYGMGYAGIVSSVDVDNPQDTTKPFHYAYDYKREKYSDWESLRITPPFPGMNLPSPTDDKTEPVDLGDSAIYDYEATLTLPPEFSVEIPGPIHQTSDFADYQASYSDVGSVLDAHRTLTITKPVVPATERDKYQRFFNAVAGNQGQFIQLARTGAASSVTVSRSDPRAEVLVQQALNSLRNRNFNNARDALAQAELINPEQRNLWAAYSALYGATNQSDKALDSIRKEIKNHPGQPEMYRTLARMQMYYQRPDDAASAWNDLLKISPGDVDAAIQLTNVLIAGKRFTEALEVIGGAVTASPDNALLKSMRVQALLRAGRKQDGIAAAKELASYSPGPEDLNSVAWELTDTETDLPLAREYASRAISILEDELKEVHLSGLDSTQLRKMNTLASAWDTAGWEHFRSGDTSVAEKYIQAAWIITQRGEAGDHLGQIYERQGRKEAAIHAWQLALAADNKLDGVSDRLQKAQPPRVVSSGKNRVEIQAATNQLYAEELGKLRTVPVPAFSRLKDTAEFFVLFSAKGVEDVAFISGAEELRAAKDAIVKTQFDMPFPDSGNEKIARRGILSCSQYTKPNCQFVLLLPSNTTPP